MAKRYFNLYQKISSPLNLWFAYKQAAKGKRYKPAAAHYVCVMSLRALFAKQSPVFISNFC
ncbi:MAG: hypothetical protein ACOYYJ_02590 [Chloroflexota bacterium]